MDIRHSLVDQFLSASALEFLAVITGIASVWLGKQERILLYPVGIVSVTIYIFIAYDYKLYADAAVNLYYLIMSIYGWYNWKHTNVGARQIPISESSKKGHMLNVSVFVLAFLLIWLLLSTQTDSDVPLWDALTTSMAVTAMYLMALKKIEHWYFWIACNLLSVPLYVYKGLAFSGLQFVVFTVIAILGLLSWRRKLMSNVS